MGQLENTISSMEVAEMVGKQHKELLRDIRKYISVLTGANLRSLDFFIPSEYIDQKNEVRPCYQVTKQGCELIGHKLQKEKGIEFSARYVNRFHEMEAHIVSEQTQLPSSPQEVLRLMFQYQEETVQKVDAIEKDVQEIKENRLLCEPDYQTISSMVRNKIRIICQQQHLNSKAKSELFKDLNGGIKKITGAVARNRIKESQFDTVIEFINNWQPSTATLTIIRQMELIADE